MARLEVIRPGNLTLLHDFGRYGLAHLGLSQGGPLDDFSFCWANQLLRNEMNCPVLEITLGQAEFHVHDHCMMAITGGDLGATLDGEPVKNWSCFPVQKGQTLKFGLPKNGLRAYLAVKHGFEAPEHFGSVSTVTRNKLGGLNQDGQPLQAGDELHFSDFQRLRKPRYLTFRYTPDYNLPLTLRVIESYQHNFFDKAAQALFYSSEFTVSQLCDRMGYRMEGPKIDCEKKGIVSEGIALGSIQVPPDGQPIILLNDRQTLGGYPKFGCIARIDLPRLAQAKPGQKVRFVQGDLAGLQDVWCQWAKFFGF
ncbi:biotin-dependent carboxyltransferase family protein [Vibrio sp. Of7-15]|uniref:5-oxoprolinase subunit C family protein n=1 Tax=Vibrio sp. Of7-15 TaxID=2724879 RepID=UPI001EF3CCCD|nr:biotin-dependent carboxyltransferase family protein [Vibrio sp. Of7-15]MCG7495485.1 biotin-dependent carboxyltransferase family protein [Vibrio sp. Of7-15]